MSTVNAVEVIAEALAKHRIVGSVGGLLAECGCGEAVDGHAAHQASVIAALPNIAVVSLPKGTVREYGGRSWGADEDDEYPIVTSTPGYDTVRLYVEDARHTRDAAVEVAGFLLAAARAAGGES